VFLFSLTQQELLNTHLQQHTASKAIAVWTPTHLCLHYICISRVQGIRIHKLCNPAS
jgi:hypothetical protein